MKKLALKSIKEFLNNKNELIRNEMRNIKGGNVSSSNNCRSITSGCPAGYYCAEDDSKGVSYCSNCCVA